MQDALYARATRGDLPHELSLEATTRLSSASLDAPLGRCSNDDPLYLRLHRLIAAGLLVPSRSEQVTAPGQVLGSFGGKPGGTSARTTTRHFVRADDLRPHLADLGEVGPLLSEWVLADDAAPAKRGETDEPWHVPLVRTFCQAIVGTGEIDPDSPPPFTARDVAHAMKKLGLWYRPEADLPEDASLRRYVIRTGGKFFAFPTGRPTFDLLPELRVERLIRLHEKAAAAAKTEMGKGIDPLCPSNFQRGAAA